MQKIAAAKLIELIAKHTGKSSEQVLALVEAKKKEFSGLLSDEGAAHIIANEQGVNMAEQLSEPLEIKDIRAGVRDVSTKVAIIQQYPVATFGEGGRVQSILCGDATGRIRIVFWHDDILKIESLSADDSYLISHLNARENQGRVELHATKATTLTALDESIKPMGQTYVRTTLKEADQGLISTFAVIVQMLQPTFYVTDAQTNKRVKEEFDPKKHKRGVALSITIDDGTNTMRCVFFANVIKQLTGLSVDELFAMQDYEKIKQELLGTMIIVQGRVVHNDVSDQKEILVQSVDTKPDPEQLMRQV